MVEYVDKGNLNLVVVESPTKTKSLSKYLGKEFKVLSSKGHIWNLPKSELGVDVKNGYEPLYEVIRGKKKLIAQLRRAANQAKKIYLATDWDREGEAIAFQVALAMNPRLLKEDVKGRVKAVVPPAELKKLTRRYQRVVFNQITRGAIRAAFENPRGFDLRLLDAQKARRVLDRLVGYTLSPLLWKKVLYGLSAGRVQSVAVRLVVERETERQNFKPHPYYRIFVETDKIKEAQLVAIDGKALEKRNQENLFAGTFTYTSTILDSRERLKETLEALRQVPTLVVESVTRRETLLNPRPPFTTATLQQAASTSLGLSTKQTMHLAQILYENGYITYHRTDSTNLAEEFLREARSYIKKEYGEQYIPKSARRYQTKTASAQEAHEAIRPTRIGRFSSTKLQITQKLGRREGQLYELIWKRTLASQMASAIYDNTTVRLGNKKQKAKSAWSGSGYLFEAKGSIVKFDGFMKVLGTSGPDRILPEVKEGEELAIKKVRSTDHITSPPPRYTEASLVKELERHGIGRPSTYAPIIETIQQRHYVEKENGYFIPTDTGKVVNSFLVEHFPEIVDLSFTAKMENDLDEVASGEKDWRKLIDGFYKPFAKKVREKEGRIEKSDQTTLGEVGENCPECGRALVFKLGRYGKFISCSNYPECDYSRSYVEKIDLKCPDCGKEHGGEVIVKHTRSGKKFWGCSRYPHCKWASWKKPSGTKS